MIRIANQNFHNNGTFSRNHFNPTTSFNNADFSKISHTASNNNLEKFLNKHLETSSAGLIYMVDELTIGKDVVYHGPFGARYVTYLDHTASGKPLQCIESFIEKSVLPYYANTHTASSYTSVQTTMYRDEAREIIKNALGGSKDDVVLFCGSGTTGCIHKLVHHLLPQNKMQSQRAVVFVGPFEHHSNLLPWREAGAKVIIIPEDKYGLLDMKVLKRNLEKFSKTNHNEEPVLLIGCFSAASNVTGITNDDIQLTIMMHKYGGLAFFDYAAGGPHVKVSMNPKVHGKPKYEMLARKDGLFLSGHKFMGGPQTTGILLAKSSVFKNTTPHGHGGGTVFFVTPSRHAYLQDIVEREEGGTPSIVESIRLGLVMKLKASIGEQNIVAREAFFTRRAFDKWDKIPNLIILGDTNNPRIPIVSFLIFHKETGFYLHHNFVATLLNDLFGIQSRGGCMCAGPYAQILLGIDEKLAKKFETILSVPKYPSDASGNQLLKDPTYDMIFRPGFTRLSLPFHATIEEVDFIVEAVEFVAENGWKFLSHYACNPADGSFVYKSFNIKKPNIINSLHSYNFTMEGLETSTILPYESQEALSHKDSLIYAQQIASIIPEYDLRDDSVLLAPELRWFLLPSDSNWLLNGVNLNKIQSSRPFTVRKHQYRIRKVESIKGRVMQGSVTDQLLNSVWLNRDHEGTTQLFLDEKNLHNSKEMDQNYLMNSRSSSSSDDSLSLITSSSSGFESITNPSMESSKFQQITEKELSEITEKLLSTFKLQLNQIMLQETKL